MPDDMTVTGGYDYRFGTAGFEIKSRFNLPVRKFFESLNIDPAEFAALMEDQYQWTEGESDIDPARIRLLEETEWAGKTVLDVGGYDGFAAEIAHKGGAARAVCLDSQQYHHYGWKDIKKEGVEYVAGDGFTWQEPVDKVILYNVLYHVWEPTTLLRHMRSICREEMLVCTLFRYHQGPWAYFYEPRECNPTDDSVLWGPSLECLERWFANTGWECERYALTHDRVLYRCTPTLEPRGRESQY